ncbi:hypothetical protein [Algoriphagus chordae]|uniref:TolB-like protein n=1 Tax=Algoriphagus chordae TaxID=237019 RepID=A0A2W7QF00_9BACT|nr:hypothetical protein [Algoriphagus chordae]PZX47094.1 hypothetical protein LV85_04052 [Algoriphagus chordae]
MKKLLFIGLIISLWGCTEEKTSSVPSYQISFSEELSLDFGEVGMSSQVPFSISTLNKNNESFLVFNSFYRRLDTIFFSPNKKRIGPGLEILEEGPGSIPDFYYFTNAKERNVFLSGSSMFYSNAGDTKKISIKDGNGSLNSISGANGKTRVFEFASTVGDYISLIFENKATGDFTLNTFNFDTESFEEIPFQFDLNQMGKHKMSFQQGPATVTNAVYPYLTVMDSTLVVSYPFFNKISVISLTDRKQFDVLPESSMFKSHRDVPKKTNGFENMAEYSEVGSEWNNGIYFGSIFRLNKNLIFRFVSDYSSTGHKYLELFDNSFNKVGEFIMSAIEPNLSPLYLPVEGKILIQSSKDPDEDIFKYYLISVDPI